MLAQVGFEGAIARLLAPMFLLSFIAAMWLTGLAVFTFALMCIRFWNRRRN